MRVALAALALGSGCVCTPLSKVCVDGTCPTESVIVKQGLQEAEEQWVTVGHCVGPVVGSTRNGSWVSPGPAGFCGEEYFFSSTGRLIAKRACCEAECQEWGVGFPMKRGPVTRKLCDEAKASLVLLGATARSTETSRIVASDGSPASVRGDTPLDRHWALPFGHYTVEYTDGGQLALDVMLAPDGGITPASAAGLELGLLLHRPGGPE